MSLCECGCGDEANPGRRFIRGHSGRGRERSDETRKKISATLTGRVRSDEHRKNLSEATKGRVPGMEGKSHSEETKKKMAIANIARFRDSTERKKISSTLIGHEVSKETRNKLSESMRNSEAAAINHENMRGGDDICKHHYLYDHSDLSLNTVEMTRSDHTRLHWLLQRLGVKIPHINILEVI